MKKTITFLCSIVLLAVINGCGDKATASDVNGATQNPAVAEADNSSSVSELNEGISKQLSGLWKLQKTINERGEETIESDNVSIEIKNNGTYIDNRGNGAWYLSFRSISNEQTETLFTKEGESGYNRDNTYVLNFANENNVNYLKLTDLKEGDTFCFIRQH